tara:strand:- start:2775 stop:3392 length:618 start_codon:yes stop_codon:yes gene_type:complete
MREIQSNVAELLGNNCSEFNGALALVTELQDSEKKTFDKQIKLAHKMYHTFEYFKSDECKQQMDYTGIVMTTEEFYKGVFGYNKSFFYDMIKVGKMREDSADTITKYKRECTKLESQDDKTAPRSIKNLLKYAKAVETDGDEAEVESTSNTLMTFAIKGECFDDEKGISIRLTADGELHVSGDEEKVPTNVFTAFASMREQIINS